ncbi:VRR-NUC domain-containing protein [Pseudomonas sp. RIT-PI-AD]|uniref:VRR-NUC domain-containing protein n=1 Tax=Pseudomonas sp. RIT-PI-AD TaxID=3035294 RepID=UPI0021D80EBC|nr:VRR-NUC domain-containing protein [Pseudomonas sp. RIT-PI-AD]
MRLPLKRRVTGARIDYEGAEQAALFDWLRLLHPEAHALAFHVPNGGHRHIKVAADLKRQGVKAGVPDIVLPMPRGGFHGLYIEFKAAKPNDAAVAPTQRAYLAALERQGYFATVCRGIDEAIQVIEAYLASGRTEVVGRVAAR